MHSALLVLNVLVSLSSIVVAIIALKRPEMFSHSTSSLRGEIFYARVFAARTIPFGFATGMLPFYPGGPSAAWLLFTAAVVQVLDAIIGLERKERPQAVLASIAAIVHALCGASLLTS